MNVPNKIILTCTITGKKVTWTNKAIIAKKIQQYGSLEAFQAQFKCKGANKKDKPKPIVALKPVLVEGVAMGKMSEEEYRNKYVTKTFSFNDGTNCTVVAPIPVSNNPGV